MEHRLREVVKPCTGMLVDLEWIANAAKQSRRPNRAFYMKYFELGRCSARPQWQLKLLQMANGV